MAVKFDSEPALKYHQRRIQATKLTSTTTNNNNKKIFKKKIKQMIEIPKF